MTEAAGRTLFRELVAEKNTTAVPDATIDLYLDLALQEFNRRVGYYYSSDTSLTTVDGTQEYTLPTGVLEVSWVEYGSTILDRTSEADLQRRGKDWRDEAKGTPTEFYTYGRTLGLYVKPNAATQLTIRGIMTPAAYTGNGFSGLNSQDHGLVVLYAAALWPHSLILEAQREQLMARFSDGAAVAKQQYAILREIERETLR